MTEHYFDNAATTRVCEEAAAAATNAMLNIYGNPSSTHAKGREAAALMKECRETMAKALGCESSEVVFTSCGSESDNFAILRGAEAMSRRGKHIITSTVEHDAVRKSMEALEQQGYEITRLAPSGQGEITAEAVQSALRQDTILVSLMMVNNETGAVSDIAEIAKTVKAYNPEILVHTDAVQGFMKIPFQAKTLGADLISISGHKIHAPKGIGALYVRKGLRLKPYILGGAQEEGRRAGTEALPQMAAFAAATKLAYEHMQENIQWMAKCKEQIIQRLQQDIPVAQILSGQAPHILTISLPGWKSEVMMNLLEARGVYVSKSSACKKGARSHVLEALNLPTKTIDGALRIGLSRYTTEEDITALCDGLREAYTTLAHR